MLSTPISEVVVGMGQETSNHFDGWGVIVRIDLFFLFLPRRKGRYTETSAISESSK